MMPAGFYPSAGSGEVAAGSDAVGGDVVSFSGVTLDAGDQNAANLQLDITSDKVWAVVFTVKME